MLMLLDFAIILKFRQLFCKFLRIIHLLLLRLLILHLLLRRHKRQHKIMKSVNAQQQSAAESLVRRARVGDQIAMDIIKKTGENARAGVVKAKSAYGYI